MTSWTRLLPRPFAELDPERVRARTSAYIYGNVLVLGGILALGPRDLEDGHGLESIGVLTLSTYLAHVLASEVADRVGHTRAEQRERLREHGADAIAILVSGTVPLVLLLLGRTEVMSAEVALALAAAVPVVRLAGTGANISRLTDEDSPHLALLSGLALAAVGSGIALLKLLV